MLALASGSVVRDNILLNFSWIWIMRTTTDFSPLYRSFIGFDHLAGLIDKASKTDKQSSYPPYNVE